MPSAVGGIAQGAGQVEAANIQAKGAQAAAESAAAAQQALAKQQFDAQVGYINQAQGQQRGAISGAGNPAFAAGALTAPPQHTPLPSMPNMGGQVYGGGQALPQQLDPRMLAQLFHGQGGGPTPSPLPAAPAAPPPQAMGMLARAGGGMRSPQ